MGREWAVSRNYVPAQAGFFAYPYRWLGKKEEWKLDPDPAHWVQYPVVSWEIELQQYEDDEDETTVVSPQIPGYRDLREDGYLLQFPDGRVMEHDDGNVYESLTDFLTQRGYSVPLSLEMEQRNP